MKRRSMKVGLSVVALVAVMFVAGALRSPAAHAQTGINCVQNPFTGVVTCFQTGVTTTTPAAQPGCIVDQFGNVLCAPYARPQLQQPIVLVPQQPFSNVPFFFTTQPFFTTGQPFFPFGIPSNCVLTIFGTVACF
ncbi:MAG TPA: hypothetical protein VFD32_18825 [Dehalococcoidia bacterium]|nr:hypothetical protein [Dehalococcoidia bacterium]